MPNTNTLAVVLSPLMDTIASARKTRELWAASFVFSRLMYHLLASAPSDHIIAPAFSAQKAHRYGAGMYADRCMIQLKEGETADVDQWLKSSLAEMAKELGVGEDKLTNLIQIDVLRAEYAGDELARTATGETKKQRAADATLIHRLNRLLDNVELSAPYRPDANNESLVATLERNIKNLYKIGYAKDSESIFITLPNGGARLPSIPEIALRELALHPKAEIKEAYRRIVEQPFSDRLTALQTLGGRGKDLRENLANLVDEGNLSEDFLDDSQLVNELFFQYLKNELREIEGGSNLIRFRHKYVAVVRLDGDGVGKAITELGQQDPSGAEFLTFSEKLSTYAEAAVKLVVEYGGTPIFSGGDDLLFLAPVAMRHNPAGLTDVLSLCGALDELFKRVTKRADLSLSGGVFVSYYKFPLGEAVKKSGDLEHIAKEFKIFYREDNKRSAEKESAKGRKELKPRHQKNAITFRVRKHSGQTFGATVRLGSAAFGHVKNILAFDDGLEADFLTSASYRLQSSPTLLAEVARDPDPDRKAAYRKHQFGKELPQHQGRYLTAVLAYADALFADYGDLLHPDEQKKTEELLAGELRSVDALDYLHTNRLFAILRLKKFLIQPDHD